MKLTANGIQIQYHLSGLESGPTVMLSHSLATDLNMWRPQHVLGESFRLLSYDTRGHGGTSAPPGPYSLELLARDATTLLDALDIERVHWVGISMGGMIGQVLALAAPERLASVSLCDTMSEIPDAAQPMWQQRIHTASSQGMPALVSSTIERWFSPGFVASADEQVAPVRAMIENTPVAGFVGCSQAIRELQLTQRLHEVNLPTLVLVGEQDPSTPVAASERIAAAIEGSQLVVLPDARHLCNIEQPGAFNDALLGFLSKHR